MPGFIAKKLCPDLVIVKSHFDKYRQVSEEVQSVLRRYDPHFCPMGLDESYLDITEYVNEIVTGMSPGTEGMGMNPGTEGMGMSPGTEGTEQSTGTGMSLTDKSPATNNVSPSHSNTIQHNQYYQCIQSVVSEIRHKIQDKTSLTASAGIAPNKMLAKVSSNFNKPNGQYFLEPSEDKVMEFVKKLPIRKVSVTMTTVTTVTITMVTVLRLCILGMWYW